MQHHKCSVCGRNDVKLYRYYGNFLREGEIYCGAHKPGSEWLVPLVEDVDGTVWGYTSVPEDAVKRFEDLPDE